MPLVSQHACEVALTITNRPLAEAERIAREAGITLRIGSEDGRIRLLTDNIDRNRVTVSVLRGIVTGATPG
jgi:hypothetical protein